MTAFTVRKTVVLLQICLLTGPKNINGIVVEAPDDLVMDQYLDARKFTVVQVDQGARCKLREHIVNTDGFNPGNIMHPRCLKVPKCGGCCGNDDGICCMSTERRTRNITLYSIAVREEAGTETFMLTEDSKCQCRPVTQAPQNCSDAPPYESALISRLI